MNSLTANLLGGQPKAIEPDGRNQEELPSAPPVETTKTNIDPTGALTQAIDNPRRHSHHAGFDDERNVNTYHGGRNKDTQPLPQPKTTHPHSREQAAVKHTEPPQQTYKS